MWSNKPLETLTLSTYGSTLFLKGIFEEARNNFYLEEENKTSIFQPDSSNDWTKVVSRTKRPLSSVILNEGISESIVTDVREFLASRKWYEERGLNYRRGYLFHGPPGCGKSSFLFALAGELDLNVCAMTLSDPAMNDNSLNTLLRSVPKRSAILLEDIDSAFVQREGNEAGNRVTFSGLLNAIDGVASAQDGQLLFMTTNHKERLAPALIRPGRVDMQVIFGLARRNQVKRMFETFFPDSNLAEEFSSQVPEGRVSMAKMQGHFLNHKFDPREALASVNELFKDEINEEDGKEAKEAKEGKEADVKPKEENDEGQGDDRDGIPNPLRQSLNDLKNVELRESLKLRKKQPVQPDVRASIDSLRNTREVKKEQ